MLAFMLALLSDALLSQACIETSVSLRVLASPVASAASAKKKSTIMMTKAKYDSRLDFFKSSVLFKESC